MPDHTPAASTHSFVSIWPEMRSYYSWSLGCRTTGCAKPTIPCIATEWLSDVNQAWLVAAHDSQLGVRQGPRNERDFRTTNPAVGCPEDRGEQFVLGLVDAFQHPGQLGESSDRLVQDSEVKHLDETSL